MPNQTTTWTPVWAAVRARQRELRWTDAHLLKQCNISDTVYRNGRKLGSPLTRPDKIAGLEHGLGWEAGSVDAILAGGVPVAKNNDMHRAARHLDETLLHPSATVDTSGFDAHFRRLEGMIEELREEERAKNQRIEQLLAKMMGGDTNDRQSGGRGPSDGDKATGNPGGTRGRRDRRADQVPAKDRGVQPEPDRR